MPSYLTNGKNKGFGHVIAYAPWKGWSKVGERDKYLGLLTERGRLEFGKVPKGRPRHGQEHSIPLNYGFPYPDSYPMDALVESVRRVFDVDGAASLKYGGAKLAARLTEQVKERCCQRGIPTDEDNIVITHGAAQSIGLVCDLLVNPGDLVLIEGPTYMGAIETFRKYSARLMTIDVDEAGMSIEHLTETLRGLPPDGMPKLLYTIPNFHNPTGYTMTVARRKQLLELADAYGFLILEDDAYGELRYEGEALPSLRALDENERVLQVGSMSKILAPAVRIGWVNGPAILSRQLDRIRSDGGANPLVKAVVAAFWDSVDVEQRLEVLRRGYRQRRDALLGALEQYLPGTCTCTRPQGGYFIWATFAPEVKITGRIPEFNRAGVTPLPGTIFYPDGRGEQQLRLSFSYPSPDEVTLGVERMAEVLNSNP